MLSSRKLSKTVHVRASLLKRSDGFLGASLLLAVALLAMSSRSAAAQDTFLTTWEMTSADESITIE